MLVKDCMTHQVNIAEPDITLKEAAEKMRDGDFGILPIHEGDRLIGMITDRDIAIRAVADGRDPQSTKVRDVMSRGVLYCYEDQRVEDVARNMGANQVRRLPVLSRQKRLVGILSLGDVALSRADSQDVEEALSQISEPIINFSQAHPTL